MWSKAKFVNRKFLMEEVYQQHQAEQSEDNERVSGRTPNYTNVFIAP